jgi:imidazoleglycerol phosphate dehydratase HisB
MFELEGIDHVALGVSDVARSAQWYIEVLGFERWHAGMWNGVPTFVGKGKTALALFPPRSNAPAPTDEHGGFGLQLACEGDLHIDAHHVIEDCALALGAAFSDALGERRGIGRFGFVLPMDDAEAKVSVDLGGRPYSTFDGQFAAARLGDYPTQLTAHVFRSLAEGMRASIHVEVTGEDDHHKTEACFKALGRALRQAIRIEGDAIPSSKGVL